MDALAQRATGDATLTVAGVGTRTPDGSLVGDADVNWVSMPVSAADEVADCISKTSEFGHRLAVSGIAVTTLNASEMICGVGSATSVVPSTSFFVSGPLVAAPFVRQCPPGVCGVAASTLAEPPLSSDSLGSTSPLAWAKRSANERSLADLTRGTSGRLKFAAGATVAMVTAATP